MNYLLEINKVPNNLIANKDIMNLIKPSKILIWTEDIAYIKAEDTGLATIILRLLDAKREPIVIRTLHTFDDLCFSISTLHGYACVEEDAKNRLKSPCKTKSF